MPNQQLRPIRIIGAASGRGAPDPRCAEGPEALRAAGLLDHLARSGRTVDWESTLSSTTPGLTPLEAVAELCPILADKTFTALADGTLPLVLSGDHSCAVGIWAGVSRAVRSRGEMGLLWIDAHLDAHTPATSHTGMIHGMPLAALLGYGEESLTECGGAGAKLRAQNLCIVGVRSFEPEEKRFLAELDVRIYYMEEIGRRGFAAVLEDALQLVRAETAGFGISIDLDAIDPLEAPGVGTPAAYGIGADTLREALRNIGRHPRLEGIELAEYNPARDRDGKTAKIALQLLGDIFANPEIKMPATEICALTDPANVRKLP
jgi:arginase